MKAIPTKYESVQFRSRLEAKWASFFDRVGWSWTYEPFDLSGYIPDFLLQFKHGNALVEIKPAVTYQEASDALTTEKMQRARSEWSREHRDFLLFGASDFDCRYHYGTCLGVMDQGFDDGVEVGHRDLLLVSDCMLAKCGNCHRWIYATMTGIWWCPACGLGGKEVIGEVEPREFNYQFREAGNEVQWRPNL